MYDDLPKVLINQESRSEVGSLTLYDWPQQSCSHLERKLVWIRGLAGEDLGTFPLSVCLETFNSRGGGVGKNFVENLDQKYYFFLTKNILRCGRKKVIDSSKIFEMSIQIWRISKKASQSDFEGEI